MIPIFVMLSELLICVIVAALIRYSFIQSMYLHNSKVLKLQLTVIDKVSCHILKLNLHSIGSAVEFYTACLPTMVCPELSYGDIVEAYVYKDPNKHIEKVYLVNCKQYYVWCYKYLEWVLVTVLIVIGFLLLLLL